MATLNKMTIVKDDEEPQQHQHEEHHVPAWLQWILVALIVINIASYFVVTWFTMGELDKQIVELQVKLKNIRSDTTTDWPVDSPQRANDNADVLEVDDGHNGVLLRSIHEDPFATIGEAIHELQHRKHKILLGTVMEIFLDSVDLVNTFVHNFWLHIIYTVVKIFSIGMWTMAQADLSFAALWFIPIGIAMLITLLLVEWYESARKYMLALLIVVASTSWIVIVFIRCTEMNHDIVSWTRKAQDSRENKTDCDQHIHKLHIDMMQAVAGTVVMLVLGLYGLVAIWLANFCVGVVFAVLYFAGDLWWIFIVATDAGGKDHLYEVPLVYALLIAAVSVLYLYELHYTQSGDNVNSSSFLKKVNSHPRLGKRATPNVVTRVGSNRSFISGQFKTIIKL